MSMPNLKVQVSSLRHG